MPAYDFIQLRSFDRTDKIEATVITATYVQSLAEHSAWMMPASFIKFRKSINPLIFQIVDSDRSSWLKSITPSRHVNELISVIGESVVYHLSLEFMHNLVG